MTSIDLDQLIIACHNERQALEAQLSECVSNRREAVSAFDQIEARLRCEIAELGKYGIANKLGVTTTRVTRTIREYHRQERWGTLSRQRL